MILNKISAEFLFDVCLKRQVVKCRVMTTLLSAAIMDYLIIIRFLINSIIGVLEKHIEAFFDFLSNNSTSLHLKLLSSNF
jgi:hypothetical protein